MSRNWTFGKKVAAGFAATVALSIGIGLIALNALRNVSQRNEHVIDQIVPLMVDAQSLNIASEKKGRAARGFLLTRSDMMLEQVKDARADFASTLERMRRGQLEEDSRRDLDAIEQDENEHHLAMDKVIAMRRTDAPIEAVAKAFEEQVSPRREELDAGIRKLVDRESERLKTERKESVDATSNAIGNVAAIIVAVVVLATFLAVALSRTLGRQIGTAVGQVQSSSSELQAAANQQASGAKQHATAMSEISTTISELLATSRQIAESSQRVAGIADDTANAARGGDLTVHAASEAIALIRRQVDQVTHHMLELGRKSQQIGAVLDIVTELAEQTNILAINATIEAAGAGESGRRFSMVADEIRKLADRVGGSSKEVRGLIDDVRSAVNTTVMATETGSKAVDSGAKQFGEVTTVFKRIADMVTTTTEAAREIELSTKQQSTAVEQVNLAIANVAQATKESETSSTQTLQTASELASLSKDLLQLVEPQPVG